MNNPSLFAREEIVIEAQVDIVWNVLADIKNWSEWQQKISYTYIDGDIKSGTTFIWKSRGITVTSHILNVVNNSTLTWSGTTIGTSAIHSWLLEKQERKTRVITEEVMSGWLPTIIKCIAPRFLAQSLQTSLRELKIEVEKRT